MEVVVAQAFLRQALERRRRDRASKGRGAPSAQVVDQDDDDVRAPAGA